MAEIEQRLFHFRGGPVDGRELWVPETPNREWGLVTVDGVPLADRPGGLPENLDEVDYRVDRYLRVDEEYVHESLVTADDDPPEHWSWRRPEGFGNRVRVLPAPPHAEDEVRLLALEMYEGGSLVRWDRKSGSAHDAMVSPFALRDDLGTEYAAAGYEIADEPSVNGLWFFGPAIPADAAWLDVVTNGGAVRFELRGYLEKRPRKK